VLHCIYERNLKTSRVCGGNANLVCTLVTIILVPPPPPPPLSLIYILMKPPTFSPSPWI